MTLELYHFEASPPCRMVRLLASYLDLDLELKTVDIMKGEQYSEEYLKLNPQHTIPTLVDGDLVLTESRAILMYLANKYGQEKEEVYPTDPGKRAIVDMRISFDSSTFYVRFLQAVHPVMFLKEPLDPAKVSKVDEALGYVETFLKENEGGFIAGSDVTIADFSMAVILSTMEACYHDFAGFPETRAYLDRCAGALKGWEEVNAPGASIYGQVFKTCLAETEG